MGLAQISYSYEYLGVNTGQFVRTELADDCFFILTQVNYLTMTLSFIQNVTLIESYHRIINP